MKSTPKCNFCKVAFGFDLEDCFTIACKCFLMEKNVFLGIPDWKKIERDIRRYQETQKFCRFPRSSNFNLNDY